MPSVKLICRKVKIYFANEVIDITNGVISETGNALIATLKTDNVSVTEQSKNTDAGIYIEQSLDMLVKNPDNSINSTFNIPLIIQVELTTGDSQTFGTLDKPAYFDQVNSNLNKAKLSYKRKSLKMEFVKQ